ncbi:MAG: type I DNA topoisomerase [Bacteroidales bacterium]|nr:type I DNA topoisomerase [Bacteroidales bacterium]
MSGKNLVIVESPHKAETIQKYLDKGAWTVKASVGHIRDLEEHSLSVDVANGFRPNYVVPAEKKRVVAELKKMAAEAQTVWLASDEDREGEAIAWHLREILGLPADKTRRISYQEITQTAFMDALAHPRDIDMNLVNAQQARRVLDRLVGFELSPILWRKIQPKLSAGRVQSVALRLIVDREKEIMAFTPEPYYRVEAVFTPEGSTVPVKALLDAHFPTEEKAREFLEASIGAKYTIISVERKESTRTPAAPFTTSTLQQEASRKLRFPIATTMRVAQTLYERGLITYMRTDSTSLSSLALGTAKKFILDNFGETYYHCRQYKTKSKGAQEAHEAIRPTFINNVEIEGSPQEKKLYELIWKRTVASQMADSRLMGTSLKVASDKRPELYGIQASELLFDGFMKMYLESRDEDEAPETEDVLLPRLSKGDHLLALEISAQCKYTAAPPRYSEATLVKKLEELEIGRPSTYQSIIGTLTTGRGYVVKGDKDGQRLPVTNLTLKGTSVKASRKTETVGAEKGKLLPQEIGLIVAGFLVDNFADILDYDFTARVEADFDQVALGKKAWTRIIESFYNPFHRHVDEVMQERSYTGKVMREIGIAPDGDPVIAAFGKFGPYVQKGTGERRQSASLAKGQLIESITLEQALKLLELPRTIGQIDGVDVVALRGKFGPYLKYGSKNVKLPRSADPLTISLEECKSLVSASEAEKQAPEYIHDWGDIKVMRGRFGPYIKQGSSNFKIPRGKDASLLTEADCQAIIAASEPTKKFTGRRRK